MFVKGVPGSSQAYRHDRLRYSSDRITVIQKTWCFNIGDIFLLKYDWVIMVLGDDDNEGDDTKARKLTWRKLWRHCQ